MTDEERAAEDAEHRRRRNLERLEGDDAMMTWCMFAGCALASGGTAKDASNKADAMIAEAKRRFT